MVKRLSLLLGSLLLVAGVVVGFMPQVSSGINCGSAFVASDDAGVHDWGVILEGGPSSTATAEGDCNGALSGVRTVAWTLVVVGVFALLVGGVSAANEKSDAAEAARQAAKQQATPEA